MVDLYTFINLSMDESYEINIFDNDSGNELLHQVEVGEIEEKLEEIGRSDLLYTDIGSWDIGYFSKDNKEEFTINIG